MKWKFGSACALALAAAGVCSGLTVMSTDEVASLSAEEESDLFWCGAQCGESWIRVSSAPRIRPAAAG